MAVPGGDKIIRPLAKIHDTRTNFAENSKPLESLAGFNSEETFGDLSGELDTAEPTIPRRKIAGPLQGQVPIQVVGESSANSSVCFARVIQTGEGREVNSDLVLGKLLSGAGLLRAHAIRAERKGDHRHRVG